MKSIRYWLLGAAVAFACSVDYVPAHADSTHTSNGGNVTSSNINTNQNANLNSNRNVNRIRNTNLNANQNINRNSNVGINRQGQSQGQGQGQGQSLNNRNTVAGGSQSYTVNNPGYVYSDANPWSNPAASAIAPSVYVSSICQTGVSAGVQFPMVGFSFGITNGKEFCIAMMQAHEYENDPAMKHYFECTSSDVRAAYKAVGRPCPQDTPKQTAAVAAPPAAVMTAAAPYKAPPNCHLMPLHAAEPNGPKAYVCN